jgi:hypothetical protein
VAVTRRHRRGGALIATTCSLLALASSARAQQLVIDPRYEEGRSPVAAALLAAGAFSLRCGSGGGCEDPLVGGGAQADVELETGPDLTVGLVAAWLWLSDPQGQPVTGERHTRALGRLALRGRAHGFSGGTWLGLEVGVARSRDRVQTLDATGVVTRRTTERQHAPTIGLALGNSFMRFGAFALSAEFSAVLAAFPQTGLGRRTFWTLALGLRYGR